MNGNIELVLMPKPSPADNVKRDVERWHRDITCFPTWHELLEVEYVRRHENMNMFTDDVLTRCKELGLLNAVEWYRRLSLAGVLPTMIFGDAIDHYSKEHGPVDTWLTQEVINEIQNRR